MFGFFERQLQKMGYSIRRIELNELEALQAVAKTTFRETYAAYIAKCDPAEVEAWLEKIYSAGALVEWVEGPQNRLLGVFDKDGALHGFSLLRLGAETAKLDKLYLLASVQGKGLGRLLQEANYSELRKCPDIRRLTLEVSETNNTAQAFYQRMGISPTETKVEYPTSTPGNRLFDVMYVRAANPNDPYIDGVMAHSESDTGPAASSAC